MTGMGPDFEDQLVTDHVRRRLALSTAQAAELLLDSVYLRKIDNPVEDLAARAAKTALVASISTYLILTHLGREPEWYAAAAHEVVTDMLTEGRGVIDSLGIFQRFGWQHTDPTRPGHSPWVEQRPDGFVPGCICGWSGRPARGKERADVRALDHACWDTVEGTSR